MATTILNIERTEREPAPRGMTVIPPAAQATAKLRVAAYCRVSSDSDDQLNSYISQVRHYTAIISENEEWEYADVYADEGITGLSADKRSDFQRMLSDCRRGLIDRILCKSVARFARNFAECMIFVRELKLLGVSVVFQSENIDTAKMSGELILSMQANRAQKESLSIAGNMRRGAAMRMKTGTFLPSSAPYGYRLNTKERTLAIEQSEAETVRRIYADYLSGLGTEAIARNMNREGMRRESKSGSWRQQHISYILTNISYTGDQIWQKKYTADGVPFKPVKNRGEKSRWYVQGCHPPIICREDFAAVQRLIDARREKFVPGTRSRHFLAGKVCCGECGTLCRRKTANGIGYWVCRKHFNDAANCPVTQAPESEILAAFERMRGKLKQHAGDILSPMPEQFKLAEDRRYRSDMKISEVNKELNSLGERVLVLERLKAKGYTEPALYISKMNELAGRIRAMRQTKRRLMAQMADGGAAAATQKLLDLLNGDIGCGDAGTNDTAAFFTAIAERVILTADGKARFRLINGLELAEPIERGRA